MRTLGSSVLEIFLPPPLNCRLNSRTAKQRLRSSPRDHRKGAIAVNRNDRYRLLRAVDLITAGDDTVIDELPLQNSICKLANGEPDCRPLYGPYAFEWLRKYLERQNAHFLFLGTNSLGQVRLATVYQAVYDELQAPHSDCYCPVCKTGYMIGDLGDNALCERDRSPVRCI
jgi:hypothetical protein